MQQYIIAFSAAILLFASCGNSGENQPKSEAATKVETVSNTVTDAAKYQKELREFYENSATTPLSDEDKKHFKGITFFPMSDKYVVEANFQAADSGKVIPFATSANKVKTYKELGIATFEMDGKPQSITLYEPAEAIEGAEDLVFIPFRDATSGLTSYGAGRYLELSKDDLKKQPIILDFNRAYNPYCAYSDDYNCPIPPQNNTLSVKIEAGVSYKNL